MTDIRSIICYIKENHGNIFRKVAFSNMLEPYIKLNQNKNLRALKLKEIDQKLSEIKSYQKLLESTTKYDWKRSYSSKRIHKKESLNDLDIDQLTDKENDKGSR